MVSIAGLNILVYKHTVIGLISIYGIVRSYSLTIWKDDKADLDTKIKDLSQIELEDLSTQVEKFMI
jgi:ribosomal protein S13